jgi:hypothetical protein
MPNREAGARRQACAHNHAVREIINMNVKRSYLWVTAAVMTAGVGAHMTSERGMPLQAARKQAAETVARGSVNADTRYLITGRPTREGGRNSVYVEVTMSGNPGENEHSAAAYPLRAAPRRWSVGALTSCHNGVRYAVMTVIVRSGDQVIASAKGKHYLLRSTILPFALKHQRSFLYGAIPWMPTEVTLRGVAGRKLASRKWSQEACNGSGSTIGEL